MEKLVDRTVATGFLRDFLSKYRSMNVVYDLSVGGLLNTGRFGLWVYYSAGLLIGYSVWSLGLVIGWSMHYTLVGG